MIKHLDIHFLNVGHGDCTIIDFPEHPTVIDINDSSSFDEDTAKELENKYATKRGYHIETLRALRLWTTPKDVAADIDEARGKLTDPVPYIKAVLNGRPLFRYIQTHADMDHMSGLYRLVEKEGIEIVNFWDTHHGAEKETDPKKWNNCPYDINDWKTYQKLRSRSDSPKPLYYKTNDQFDFFNGDGIGVWAPFENTPTDDEDLNSRSYVLRVQFGKCRILLGGDAPISVWEELFKRFPSGFPKINLLKAPHHGRKSGYHWQSVKAMEPDITVLSVGDLKKKDDAAASYEKYSTVGAYTTREFGTMSARCWEDGDVWLYDEAGNKITSSMESLSRRASA